MSPKTKLAWYLLRASGCPGPQETPLTLRRLLIVGHPRLPSRQVASQFLTHPSSHASSLFSSPLAEELVDAQRQHLVDQTSANVK